MLGALGDYVFLLSIGGLNPDNYLLAIFFSIMFMVFAGELVLLLRLFNLDIDGFALTAGEVPQIPLDGYQKALVTLITCLALLWFQTRT